MKRRTILVGLIAGLSIGDIDAAVAEYQKLVAANPADHEAAEQCRGPERAHERPDRRARHVDSGGRSVVDDRGHIVEANTTALRTSGYAWDELKALPNAALFPPETWDDVLAMFKRALAGETLAREVRVVTQ